VKGSGNCMDERLFCASPRAINMAYMAVDCTSEHLFGGGWHDIGCRRSPCAGEEPFGTCTTAAPPSKGSFAYWVLIE
jgi:hypothetical protein